MSRLKMRLVFVHCVRKWEYNNKKTGMREKAYEYAVKEATDEQYGQSMIVSVWGADTNSKVVQNHACDVEYSINYREFEWNGNKRYSNEIRVFDISNVDPAEWTTTPTMTEDGHVVLPPVQQPQQQPMSQQMSQAVNMVQKTMGAQVVQDDLPF